MSVLSLQSTKLECLGGLPDIKLLQQLTYGVHPDFFGFAAIYLARVFGGFGRHKVVPTN